MLATVGAILIGIVVLVLAVLNGWSRSVAGARWLEQPMMAEALTAAIVALLAVGIGLYLSGGAGPPPAWAGPTAGTLILVGVLIAFGLMWRWFKVCARVQKQRDATADDRHRLLVED